jgi:hypothetical protein
MDDTTIDLPEIAPNEQLDTPRKNRILGYIDCCQINGLKWTKVGVAKLYKVHRMQVDYAIKNPHPHTKKNSELKKGNARKITDKDLDAVERFIEETESDSHSVNWYDIVYRLDLNVTGGHLSKVMKPRQIATYMTTEKTLVLAKLAARRVEWCKTMLARYPKKEDWRHVRFSGEVHFGWSPEGLKDIQRRKGTRPTKEDAAKRLHYWTSCGYEFKEDLVAYETISNTNTKMSQETYIARVLQPYVCDKWSRNEPYTRWCLEEDGDSGYGTGNNSTAWQFKQFLGLSEEPGALHSVYQNCGSSPDFSIIQDSWSYPKSFVKKSPHWDATVVDELAKEGWRKIPQGWINRLVDGMPQRLQDCIDSGGQMVGGR